MALNGNQITDAGLVVLAEVLRENTTLKDLGLYGNPMSDAAKQAVLAIVDDERRAHRRRRPSFSCDLR